MSIRLKQGEQIDMRLVRGKIILLLGSARNKFVIQNFALWKNAFSTKSKSLTRQYYVYDATRARKLMGDGETLILGSTRNALYFGKPAKADSSLEPEHVRLSRSGKLITITCLALSGCILILKVSAGGL